MSKFFKNYHSKKYYFSSLTIPEEPLFISNIWSGTCVFDITGGCGCTELITDSIKGLVLYPLKGIFDFESFSSSHPRLSKMAVDTGKKSAKEGICNVINQHQDWHEPNDRSSRFVISHREIMLMQSNFVAANSFLSTVIDFNGSRETIRIDA